jgi:hypothetical protein
MAEFIVPVPYGRYENIDVPNNTTTIPKTSSTILTYGYNCPLFRVGLWAL